MASSGTLIGLALIIGAIAAVALQPKDAAKDGTGPGDPPPPGNTPPADEFIPVVTGNPKFEVNPF